MGQTEVRCIAVFGAGGMGREAACVIERINASLRSPKWQLIGFFDDGREKGSVNEFGKILGGIAELNQYPADLALVIAIGNPEVLRNVYEKIQNPHISFPNIVDPTVDVWHPETFAMGEGNIICPYCQLSCNVSIGSFNLLNGDVSLRHDVLMKDFNSLMPGVRISGGVRIGSNNFFGMQASVVQYKTISDGVKVGAGAIVMNDITSPGLYVGIPAISHSLKAR